MCGLRTARVRARADGTLDCFPGLRLADRAAFGIAAQAGSAAGERAIPVVAVVLFAMLMVFMGGRIIAPVVAGQFYRQGHKLDARVQPRIESLCLSR
jgi:uncharacterized protein involved in response to NO